MREWADQAGNYAATMEIGKKRRNGRLPFRVRCGAANCTPSKAAFGGHHMPAIAKPDVTGITLERLEDRA